MKPFAIDNQDMINKFTGGRDFNEIMGLLPHYEDEDFSEIYMDMINDYSEETDDSKDSYIQGIRDGFEYLFGALPEDITEETLRGVTRDIIAERAEAIED